MPARLTSATPICASDVDERAVALVAIEPIEAALGAVGDVEVLPAVAIEVGDGDRRAHRRDLRHDVLEPRVERRRLVHEIDPHALGRFLEPEAVARDIFSIHVARAHTGAVERLSATTAASDATNSIVHTTQSARWRAG